jgi:hypothetical protein
MRTPARRIELHKSTIGESIDIMGIKRLQGCDRLAIKREIHAATRSYSQTSSFLVRYSPVPFLLLLKPRSELKRTATRKETLAPTSADITIGVVIVGLPSDNN